MKSLFDILAEVFTASHPDYGNSFEYAAAQLRKHYIAVHNDKIGGRLRPYQCETCRNLWIRASYAEMKNRGFDYQDKRAATPIPYRVIGELVMATTKAYAASYNAAAKGRSALAATATATTSTTSMASSSQSVQNPAMASRSRLSNVRPKPTRVTRR